MKIINNNKGLSLVMVIMTVVFLSVLITAFTSYMSARQLTYPLQNGSYQAYMLANAGVELAMRYARDNLATFISAPGNIIPTQNGPCTPSSTWRTVTIAGSGSANTIDLCYDNSPNNRLHSVGKAMAGSWVVATREVRLSNFMGYVASGCAIFSSGGCRNKAVFSQVPGQPIHVDTNTLTQPTFANINGYSSASVFGVEVSWTLTHDYCSNPDINSICINGTSIPNATYDVNHNGTWNHLPIHDPQSNTTYRIKFQDDTAVTGGRWDMGLTFAAAPSGGTYTMAPAVRTTGSESSWTYNGGNYRDITQGNTTYAGPGGGTCSTGNMIVTNKTGGTLYYKKNSGSCTAWAPNTTVTLTHSVGDLMLWLNSSCSSTNYCGTDYDHLIVIDNDCNANCQTKIITGTTGTYPCGTSYVFVDS